MWNIDSFQPVLLGLCLHQFNSQWCLICTDVNTGVMQKIFITSKCAKKTMVKGINKTKLNNKKKSKNWAHSAKTRNINQQTSCKYYKMRKNTIKTVMKDNFKVSPSQGFCQTIQLQTFILRVRSFLVSFGSLWLLL